MVSRTSDYSDYKMPSGDYERYIKKKEKGHKVLSMRPSICGLCSKWDDGTFPIPITVCPNCMSKIFELRAEIVINAQEIFSINRCIYCLNRTGFKMFQVRTMACRKCIDKIARNARITAAETRRETKMMIKRKGD